MDRESLASHLLMQDLLENIKPAIDKIFEASKKSGSSAKFFNKDIQVEFTEKEEYHNNVFKSSMNIYNSLGRISAISVFISTFPSPKRYSKNGIYKKDWVTYHYANFVMAKVSLYDMALLLVNQVFDLGLKPQTCNKETVRENRWIKNSKDIAYSIDALENATTASRYPRNLYLHRGISPNLKYIDILDIYDFTSSYSDHGISPADLEDLFKMAFQEVAEEIKEDLDKLEPIIIRLFDAVLLEYNKRI